ncbi:ferrous iron transport protein B [Cruoricaptor ignavus]|uniref:Ferrous iron transport protein B n=1 Tax=Cruoricaptor ignavus TaxID=1118202 RepID=A0A7M1T2W4_9FLAO|nr:ferrous iron transport protein B [Cruoricaptor ignavus]QOR73253.1 ferrous iron transport protein B [Cruoricaptor ignavus]
MQERKEILLVGNPNVGKSTIFNALCNTTQKTGNYAGVTVASLSGNYTYRNQEVQVVDLPGAYSIYPSAEDDAVFARYLFENQENYSGIVYIIEALNLKRGLLLFQQLQDLGLPLLVVINQTDEAEKRGITIDLQLLSEKLGVKVLGMNAKAQQGIDALKEAIHRQEFSISEKPQFEIPAEHTFAKNYNEWAEFASGTNLPKNLSARRLQTQETVRRYQNIEKFLPEVYHQKPDAKELLTEKLDKILVHPVLGYIIFGIVLLMLFQAVFWMAEFPMSWIEDGFSWLSAVAHQNLPEGPLNSLVSNGIIPGIGGIVVFAPQIGILMFFLYLLEDSGYMARAVFLMDRFLRPFGLNGKSVVPLVSGTACAIPAIMAARNIENAKERLITVLVTPFMTCSARLPIYTTIITLVIPSGDFLGIRYDALALLAMYILGFLAAIFSAFILDKIIKTGKKSFLVMDLPTYKMPMFWKDFKLMLARVWEFINGAGRIIFFISIIIWFFSFIGPKTEPQQKFVATDVEMQDSYLAKAGQIIEPAIKPLGYDWKIGVGILTSFVAREVFVGTMSTLYSLEEDAPETKLIEKMHADTWPSGEKIYSLATGLSILVFYAFAMQCASTVAIVYRETQSWKWTAGQMLGMTALAYIAAFLVYQIFK